MCLHDLYVLRLANTSKSATVNNPLTLSADKASVSVRIPDDIRKKGKCQISIVDATIQLQLANTAASRVVPANTHIVSLGWDLPVLGFDNEVTGTPQIFGSCASDVNSKNACVLDSVQANTFTCLALPPTITITRFYYDANGLIKIANTFSDAVVPFQVTLNIQFFEDDKKE